MLGDTTNHNIRENTIDVVDFMQIRQEIYGKSVTKSVSVFFLIAQDSMLVNRFTECWLVGWLVGWIEFLSNQQL
jgi:hypothetical protein